MLIKFLPNLSSRLKPLRLLLKMGVEGNERELSFNEIKGMLLEDKVLNHFEQDFEVTLDGDKSSYKGLERCFPIRCMPRDLSPKRGGNMAKIEREALALYWGICLRFS